MKRRSRFPSSATYAGKRGYYEILQNQQNLFPAENTLARTELNQLLAIVQLYKALGGGWQEYETTTSHISSGGE